MASIKPICAGILLALLAAPLAVHAQVKNTFDLPAQALSGSLRELGSQAQVNVIFDPAAIGVRRAPALKGRYELKQALAKLLEGSGFKAEFTDANTVVIKPLPSSPGPSRSPPSKPVVDKSAQRSEQQPEPVTLADVTVLGSLIPRAQVETASPLIVITAEQIKNRGFSSVADALQNSTVNTGAVSNTSIGAIDNWAQKTVSLFGLDPSYTKFLIDGRPMPMFSQPVQGSFVNQMHTNLTGIPIDMVERIEILPGGQSSLYGSDAIAGVVNIVLKNHARFGTLNARVGWYPSGGGRERSLSFSNSFSVGKLDMMLAAQVNDQEPLWNSQRRITAQNFADGIAPQRPSPVAYVQGFSGAMYYPQPEDCARIAGLWGGSVRYYDDGRGAFCGTVRPVTSTLLNKNQAASASMHATYTVNDDVQLYADVLGSYQKQARALSGSFFAFASDPNLQDINILYRTFAPEEMASSRDGLLTEKNYEGTYTATIGSQIGFGAGWDLDVAFTHSYERNNNRQSRRFGDGVPGSYGSAVLGPQLGTDFFGMPIHAPDYDLLFTPLTPAQYASYVGAASVLSTNRNDLLRAQLTQRSLFTLPGGDAGLAVVAEQGYENWKYQPSPLFTSGTLQGYVLSPSGGHRNRYAVATELVLPVFKMLTVDLASRYDSYNAEGAHFSHPTYSLGLEFRPFESLLLRGKYSTSFKAPSLVDQFEGGSTSQALAYDYVNCFLATGGNISDCPPQFLYTPITLIETSNPHLQPLTARTFSYGLVWSPTSNLSMSLDYQHVTIENEVLKQHTGYLGDLELQCMNGMLDPQSPTCQDVAARIVRGPAIPGSPLLGPILQETTTKINLASEVNNAINASINYKRDVGVYGHLLFEAAYTRVQKHTQQNFPGDPVIDYLADMRNIGEFRTKGNAAVTWSKNAWSATLYGTYFGPTPNNAAYGGGPEAPHARMLPAWRIFNANVNYSPTPAWRLSVGVNNLKNSMPPFDETQYSGSSFPFNPSFYNPYGRQVFVEARYQFGGGND